MWEKEFWNRSRNEFVRSEYKKLLQIGKTNSQAEEVLLTYCTNCFADNSLSIGEFYTALALAQWSLGRLSCNIKEMAFLSFPLLKDVLGSTTIEAIQTILFTPQPAEIAISKARVRHCPWQQGSLLAYHIQNGETAKKSPYWNKYVLLRVIKIVRWPFSQLLPDECFSETMLVGLYDWFGDSLPDPEEVTNARFTVVSESPARLQMRHFDPAILQKLSDTNESVANQVVNNMTKRRVETCYSLSWDRASRQNGTITFLGCDADFHCYGFSFQTNITDYSIGGPHAFDGVLCNRLESMHGKVIV